LAAGNASIRQCLFQCGCAKAALYNHLFLVVHVIPAAFLEYEDDRDAQDAVRKLDGYKGWVSDLS
jgi:hypothetical protein